MNETTNQRRSFGKRLAIWTAVALVACAAAFAVLGKSIVEKLVTDLFMPLGILWMILTVLVVVLLKRRLYFPSLIAAMAWIFCFLAGNSIVSSRLISSLENDYSKIDPLAIEPLETVVLLGGATSEAPNGQVQINDNGDRLVLAARMYHRGLAKRIICTGARIEGLSTLTRDEAEASKLLLIDLGVDDSAIGRFGGRNTSEEMQQIAENLGSDVKVGIITSAWHLPRAIRLAKDAGINAVPLPADFSGESDEPKPFLIGRFFRRCIPNQSALGTNSRVLKEHLASLVGR